MPAAPLIKGIVSGVPVPPGIESGRACAMTVMLRGCETVTPPQPTETVNDEVMPAGGTVSGEGTSGAPLRIPVAAASVIPAGNAPPVTLHVHGGGPPASLSACQ